MLAAVDDLGRRINNIRHDNFLSYLSVEDRSDEAVLSTLFRFAQYLGWTEIVDGYADRLRFEDNEATKEVADSIGDIAWILSADRFDRTDEADFRTSQLMLWREEQRAIGELMRSTDGTPLGFNSFSEKYDTEKCGSGFAKWFCSFAAQLRNESAPRTDRLTELQQVLAWLAQQLDADHVLVKREDNGKVVEPRWAQPEMIGPRTRWTDVKFVSSRPSGTSQSGVREVGKPVRLWTGTSDVGSTRTRGAFQQVRALASSGFGPHSRYSDGSHRSRSPRLWRVWSVLIPMVGAVLVAVIAAAAQVINSRNDRAQAHQEVDLLRKLDPTSDTAKELAEVLQARIGRWHQKFYKATPKLEGSRRLRPSFEGVSVVIFVLIYLLFITAGWMVLNQ